jgi:hypothetical protein
MEHTQREAIIMSHAGLTDLAIQLRAHAKNEEFGIRRNLLRAAADAIEGLLPSAGSEAGLECEAVRQFLLERKVNLMRWQWKRVEGPPTMRRDPDTDEWTEL